MNTSWANPVDQGFWSGALASPLTLQCMAVMFIGLIMLALGVRVCWQLGRNRRAQQASLVQDTSGVATIEFAMGLPILLLLILFLTQTMLVMGGNIFVHYAAYAAARAAVVQIPSAYPNEAANVYNHSPGQQKHDAIKRAAAMALVPVSGRMAEGSDLINADDFTSGLSTFYNSYSRNEPNWVERLAGYRVNYAAAHTDITVAVPEVTVNEVTFEAVGNGQAYTFAAKDPVTIQVLHKLNLSIPWANRLIFADGEHDAGHGYYSEIWATSTLSIEGIRDDMPPQPTLPRIP